MYIRKHEVGIKLRGALRHSYWRVELSGRPQVFFLILSFFLVRREALRPLLPSSRLHQTQQNAANARRIAQLEEAARRSFLNRAQSHPSDSGPARFDLRSVFRAMGATGEEPKEVLTAARLRQALAEVFNYAYSRGGREAGAAIALPFDDDDVRAGAADVAAGEVAARILGETAAIDQEAAAATAIASIDYRRFEDWVLPARGVEELRGVLAELVEDGAALGLTVVDLFAQVRAGRTAGSDSRVAHEGEREGAPGESCGIGKRQLQGGLGALSVHLTETEAETLLKAAGRGRCGVVGGGGDSGDSDEVERLSLEMFSALAKCKGSRGRQRRPIPTSVTTTAPRSAEVRSSTSSTIRSVDDDAPNAAIPEEYGELSPDSLAAATPRISLPLPSELGEEAATRATAGPESGSSSAAVHVEVFGRVAADVQAVLASAVSSTAVETATGNGNSSATRPRSADGDGRGDSQSAPSGESSDDGGRRGGGRRVSAGRQGGRVVTASPLPAGPDLVSRTKEGRNAVGLLVPSSRSSREEDSVPVPLTRATTPPFGSARSPSAPLHPTRASRERLKAALETLDLKERLRPTVGGSTTTKGEQRATARVGQEGGAVRASGSDSLCKLRSRTSLTGNDGSSGGGGGRRGARRLGIGAVAFGSKGGGSSAGAAARSRDRAKECSEHRVGGISLEAEHGEDPGYISMEAAEIIGRLRARVAELELSEQV